MPGIPAIIFAALNSSVPKTATAVICTVAHCVTQSCMTPLPSWTGSSRKIAVSGNPCFSDYLCCCQRATVNSPLPTVSIRPRL